MDYTVVEQELINLFPEMKIKRSEGGNFVTPSILGYIKLLGPYKVEVSYGKPFGSYMVGFTMMFSNNEMLPVKLRKNYNKPFLWEEIQSAPEHIEWLKTEIKELENED